MHDFDNYGKCCECGKWRHQVAEEEEAKYQKSPCCNGNIRATIDQTARISVDFQGSIDWTDDHSEPEVAKGTMYCEECGEDLGLVDGIVQRTAQVLPKEEDEKCADCGENMYGTVRIHHHTEDGKDVTR